MNTTTTRKDSVVGLNGRIDRLERRALLCALWMFVLLNLNFRDLHEIVKAEFLADAVNGVYNGREVTEAMFLLGGIIVEIPIVMMLMAWVLPLRPGRWANIDRRIGVTPSTGHTFPDATPGSIGSSDEPESSPSVGGTNEAA